MRTSVKHFSKECILLCTVYRKKVVVASITLESDCYKAIIYADLELEAVIECRPKDFRHTWDAVTSYMRCNFNENNGFNSFFKA